VSFRSVDSGAQHRRTAAAADWLARITDPDASEQDFRAWQEWLTQDPAHAVAYEQMERIWALTAHLPPAPMTAPVAELTLAEIQEVSESLTAQQTTRVRPAWRRLLIASAASAAAIAVGIVLMLARWNDGVFETATAEQRSVRLTDGSQVVLGAETRIAVRMGEKQRSLEMDQGVAYFKVAHDKARPFVVKGGGFAIEAVGTAFSVDTKPERVVVTVTEGVVRVARQSGRTAAAGSGPVLVHAGERIAINAGKSQCAALDDASSAALGWRDGRLEYVREELRYVIADVNRYSDRKIVFAQPDIGRLEFSGTLFLEHIDEWLDTLQGSFPVKVAAGDDTAAVVLQALPGDALAKALSGSDANRVTATDGDNCSVAK
jgi:transmembrane sensor